MEQARLFLAIALSFLIFLVWEFFFVEKKPVHRPEQSPPSEQVMKKEDPYVAKEAPYAKESEPATDPAASLPSAQGRTITVNTPFYSVRISEKGALFQSVVLRDYKERVGDDSPLKEMIPPKIHGLLRTGFLGNSVPELESALFSADIQSDMTDVLTQPAVISFSWRSAEGIVLEKRFLFSPETYLIGLAVTLKNGSDRVVRDSLTLSLANVVPKTSSYSFEGPSAFINNSLEQVTIGDIEDKSEYRGHLKWIAIEDRYFTSAIIPTVPGDATMRLSVKDDVLENRYVHPLVDINPETQKRFEFDLFIGPKSLSILSKLERFRLTESDLEKLRAKGLPEDVGAGLRDLEDHRYASQEAFEKDLATAIGEDQASQHQPLILKHAAKSHYGLDRAIDFGWFDVIAKPCLLIMNFLYGFIPNYGIAIIILTVGIKLILWPLGNKSYKSMNEMKKIQPLMTEIREKHKDDKKRMNQEMMNLYKTYKVNPMGGCLPMILQIPIFIALYRMLYEAIELRHAPFVGWVNDLSSPDRLFDFGNVPFISSVMEPPIGIPVLTIVMGATMLLQQKMSPPPGDPAQAKLMMLMPIVFTVIFVNFSSGLVLYWLTNNILSISQQYYISKKPT